MLKLIKDSFFIKSHSFSVLCVILFVARGDFRRREKFESKRVKIIKKCRLESGAVRNMSDNEHIIDCLVSVLTFLMSSSETQ